MPAKKKARVKKYYRKDPGILGYFGAKIEVKPHFRKLAKKKKKR